MVGVAVLDLDFDLPLKTQLSRLFRTHRQRRDLTQSGAAGLIQVSVSSLDSYERGRRFPKVAQLDSIFKVYDLSGSEQIRLLELLVQLRPRSYRWVVALIQTDPDHKLIRDTLRAYAELGVAESAAVSRADVPVPRRVFPSAWAKSRK